MAIETQKGSPRQTPEAESSLDLKGAEVKIPGLREQAHVENTPVATILDHEIKLDGQSSSVELTQQIPIGEIEITKSSIDFKGLGASFREKLKETSFPSSKGFKETIDLLRDATPDERGAFIREYNNAPGANFFTDIRSFTDNEFIVLSKVFLGKSGELTARIAREKIDPAQIRNLPAPERDDLERTYPILTGRLLEADIQKGRFGSAEKPTPIGFALREMSNRSTSEQSARALRYLGENYGKDGIQAVLRDRPREEVTQIADAFEKETGRDFARWLSNYGPTLEATRVLREIGREIPLSKHAHTLMSELKEGNINEVFKIYANNRERMGEISAEYRRLSGRDLDRDVRATLSRKDLEMLEKMRSPADYLAYNIHEDSDLRDGNELAVEARRLKSSGVFDQVNESFFKLYGIELKAHLESRLGDEDLKFATSKS